MATAEDDTRGWQFGKSVTECLQHMLDNHVFCDVTFEVRASGKPAERIPAHRLILQARSAVFEAMFSGGSVDTGGDFFIIDMEPELFKVLLRYMYTEEVTLTGENSVPLLHAANKYNLENLAEKCREFFDKEITSNNVCSVLTQCLVYQEEDLLNKCLELIGYNSAAVIKTESFLNMSHDALLKVVKCDHLAHGVEAELFAACLQWARRRVRDPGSSTDGEVRQLLGDECIHKIRFPYMTVNDFGTKFGRSSVLSADEKLLIYPSIGTIDAYYSAALADLGFDVTSRMMRVNRFGYSYSTSYSVVVSGDTEEDFTFSVNKPIQLRGFSIKGGPKDAEHDVTITLTNTTKQGDPYKTEHKIKSSGDGQPIPVYFRKTRVEAGDKWRVSVRVKGTQNMGVCIQPRNPIQVQDLTFTTTYTTHPPTTNGHTNAGYTAEFLYQLLVRPE